MGNLGGYNETEVEVGGFEELAVGKYKVCIEDTELKESKAGNEYVSCKLAITEGPKEGSYHYENLNVGHDNADVVARAHKTIKEMSVAMGITGVNNHEDLRFDSHKKFMVMERVAGKKEGQIFTNFKSAAGFVQAAAPAEQAAPAGDKPSWQK